MAEVKRVTSSSSLGELLYGYVHGLLNADGLQSHITNALEKLADTKITVEAWNAWKVQMAEEIADYSQNPVLLRKRVIEVEIWGVKVPVNVQSPLLELNCRADAYLKTLSLGKADGLEMLLFETWCFPSRDTPEIKSEVDVELIRHMQAARKVASEVLTPSVISCCADVVKLLEGAREALLSLDQSFCLELSFVASSLPASLSASIEKRCLDLLPTSTLQRSLVEVKHGLHALSESHVLMISERSMQDKILAVIECLDCLARNSPPPSTLQGEFFTKVMDKVQYFYKYVGKKDLEGKPHPEGITLYGRDAVKLQMQELREAVASDPKSLNLSKLDGPQCYKWLLSVEDAKSLDTLVAKCLSGSAKSQSSGAGSSSDPAKKKKKVHDPGSSSSVMKFF